jgi:hypothetical protein
VSGRDGWVDGWVDGWMGVPAAIAATSVLWSQPLLFQ